MLDKIKMPNRSYLIAASIALVATVWVLSGVIFGSENVRDTASRPGDDRAAAELMAVEVRNLRPERITRSLTSQGTVEPNRAVNLRAQTAGPVAEVVAEEGRPVAAGDVIVRLAMQDREARLAEAEALVQERTAAFEAAERLRERGHQSQRQYDEAFSNLQEARARLAAIRQEIENVTIRAPFGGILERRMVEEGDYASVGTEIATVVDNDPIIVVVQIAQQDVGSVRPGREAQVVFATGDERDGRVRYVGSRADEATRTFRVEIEVPNPDNALRSGTSADARLPVGEVSAHFISPSLLTLNEAGALGIKTVNDEDVVEFHPVSIVQADPQGVWVTGLPGEVRVITVGQGFAQPGERVRPVPAETNSGNSGEDGGDAQ